MKRILCVFLCLTVLLCLSACKKDAGDDLLSIPDFSTLAQELMDSGAFTDELSVVAADAGCLLYGIDSSNALEMLFVMSSGATAEEIAIFRCSNAAEADILRAVCDERAQQQSSLYASYKPEEVPKLDAALILERDNVLVFCVSADAESAKAVLTRYFKA